MPFLPDGRQARAVTDNADGTQTLGPRELVTLALVEDPDTAAVVGTVCWNTRTHTVEQVARIHYGT